MTFQRGLAMGIVGKLAKARRTLTFPRFTTNWYSLSSVAGYGLSAFLYASISGLIIGDNTELFLLVLAIGTFVSLFGAGVLLTGTRMQTAYSLLPGGSPPEPERTLLRRSTSRSTGSTGTVGERDGSIDDEQETELFDESEERGRPRAWSGSSLLPQRVGAHKKKSSILVKQAGEALERAKKETMLVETGSLGLFKVPDYYLLMLVAFCCTGTGIMWINSVGTVVGECATPLGGHKGPQLC